MTIKEFNNLKVTSLVIPPKEKAAGPAYRIDRTNLKLKPFGSRKWYSYKSVKIFGVNDHGLFWSPVEPPTIIEVYALSGELKQNKIHL